MKEREGGRAVKVVRVTTHDISLNGLLRGQLRYLSEHGMDVVGVAADTGVLDDVRSREGVRCIDLPMHREVSLRADLRSLRAMIKLLRRERPHIVHANTPKGSLLAMVAAWYTRVPVRIYTVTGLRFETATGTFRRILKLMERITCRCATEVIPEGDGVARTLRREHITRKPLRKIHNGNINGVDTAHFDPTLPELVAPAAEMRRRLAEGSDGAVTTFVFVGRMVRDKGINELVDAFNTVHAANPATRLLLVGRFEDALDPVLPATRLRIDQGQGILAVGQLSDVRPALLASDVLVLPSYREGFPNVVLEGAAMGLPVIVTDVNGADEVITPGQNGLIIPRRDTAALAAAMTALAADPARRAALAAAARPVITTRFSRPDVWAQTLSRYQSLLPTQ